MKTTLPTNMKWCVACRNWGGCRRPNAPLNSIIEYDTDQKGVCCLTNLETVPNQWCSKWEQQFKK